MAEVMSEERLAEIRKECGPRSIFASGMSGDGLCVMVNELLAEVDRLRKQLADVTAQRDEWHRQNGHLRGERDQARAEAEQLRTRQVGENHVFVSGWHAHAEACQSLVWDAREAAWRKYREEMTTTLAKAVPLVPEPDPYDGDCDCGCQPGQPCLCPERDCYCGPCRVCDRDETEQQPEDGDRG